MKILNKKAIYSPKYFEKYVKDCSLRGMLEISKQDLKKIIPNLTLDNTLLINKKAISIYMHWDSEVRDFKNAEETNILNFHIGGRGGDVMQILREILSYEIGSDKFNLF